MTEVKPGIYQLRLPLPPGSSVKYVNDYLIQGDNEYLLIDTGWNTDEAFEALKGQLAEIRVSFEEIAQIVITHIHPDHYGLSGRLKQLSPAKIALHHLEENIIGSRYINMEELLQQIKHWLHTNGVAANELPELQMASLGMAKFVAPTLPDIIFRGEETVAIGSLNFRVVWTPGHSPGHISLYEPTQKILAAGDHILPTITPNIGLHPQSSSNPLADYLNSLNALKQFDVTLVLPGHESPFTGLAPRIEALIQHHKQRNTEIIGNLAAKSKTAYQISTEISWMSDGISWQSLSPRNKRLALLETIAHLESMGTEGKVDKFSKNSIIYYQSS
ncbi:MBL fold metallo-hydrolase [Chloroflexota bacterium]